jgi:hypothetical protein
MASKAAVEHLCDVGNHKVHADVRCVTEDCEHRGKSWDGDSHHNWDHDYACKDHFTSAKPTSNPPDRANHPNRKLEGKS